MSQSRENSLFEIASAMHMTWVSHQQLLLENNADDSDILDYCGASPGTDSANWLTARRGCTKDRHSSFRASGCGFGMDLCAGHRSALQQRPATPFSPRKPSSTILSLSSAEKRRFLQTRSMLARRELAVGYAALAVGIDGSQVRPGL
jgi:hypothetical protein